MGGYGKATDPHRRQKEERKRKKEKGQQKGTTQRNQLTPAVKVNHNKNEIKNRTPGSDGEQAPINLSASIPVTLQQLVLNVFRHALLSPAHDDGARCISLAGCCYSRTTEAGRGEERLLERPALDVKSLIQTIKSHLYHRDFQSAFTNATDDLLWAYALRWSATRALGYAGIFKGVLETWLSSPQDEGEADGDDGDDGGEGTINRVICLGGGAGAEVLALAAAWRDITTDTTWAHPYSLEGAGEEVEAKDVSQNERTVEVASATETDTGYPNTTVEISGMKEVKKKPPNLSVVAVDIADWSIILEKLTLAIQCPLVPGSKMHPSPLLPRSENNSQQAGAFDISFRRLDVLDSQNEPELRELFDANLPEKTNGYSAERVGDNGRILITLMFTLNELFTTSMAKATALLLRLTDWSAPGTILFIIDSPGSYSTLSLGKSKPDQQLQQRNYPMKFLLDHILLSTAAGKWDRVHSEDSRWFRRDVTRLRYHVGEGVGLEDMRFQIHLYCRSGC
jgi:25S rRNA (uracil2843-N3)-methyltransferase